MAINLFLIGKWARMLLGKSAYHVHQTEGLAYSKDKLQGYYNNLTEKITRFGMPGDEVPITSDDDGSKRHFSIAIFQYGLAAYDLYLMNDDKSMLRKLKKCADWAVENQELSGAWKTFEPQNPNEPYSAMAQGEGISLLVRCALAFNDKTYLEAASKAFDFLLLPRKDGGVAEYKDNGMYLYEYTYEPLVLNGWIFSAWGLLDYYKSTGDERAKEAWELTTNTMTNSLHIYDCKYWSRYNDAHAITSMFYHKLHIAQLNVMYNLTSIATFKEYADRWERYRCNPFNKYRAFLVKVLQKLKE
jgi:hypothetical protein